MVGRGRGHRPGRRRHAADPGRRRHPPGGPRAVRPGPDVRRELDLLRRGRPGLRGRRPAVLRRRGRDVGHLVPARRTLEPRLHRCLARADQRRAGHRLHDRLLRRSLAQLGGAGRHGRLGEPGRQRQHRGHRRPVRRDDRRAPRRRLPGPHPGRLVRAASTTPSAPTRSESTPTPTTGTPATSTRRPPPSRPSSRSTARSCATPATRTSSRATPSSASPTSST